MNLLYSIGQILVAGMAVLHVYILVLEMFLWTRPAGLRAFRQSLENAMISKTLAANQGLYNGFLAAGLFWGLFLGTHGLPQENFFLGCILLAGIYGATTVGRKILFIQAIPAAISLTIINLASCIH